MSLRFLHLCLYASMPEYERMPSLRHDLLFFIVILILIKLSLAFVAFVR